MEACLNGEPLLLFSLHRAELGLHLSHVVRRNGWHWVQCHLLCVGADIQFPGLFSALHLADVPPHGLGVQNVCNDAFGGGRVWLAIESQCSWYYTGCEE